MDEDKKELLIQLMAELYQSLYDSGDYINAGEVSVAEDCILSAMYESKEDVE